MLRHSASANRKTKAMAGKRIDYVYSTDEGRLYAVFLKFQTPQINQALGLEILGTQDDPLLPNQFLTRPPVGLRLRKIALLQPETGNVRELVVGSLSAPVWNLNLNSLDLLDYNDLEVKPYRIIERISERQFNEPKPDL